MGPKLKASRHFARNFQLTESNAFSKSTQSRNPLILFLVVYIIMSSIIRMLFPMNLFLTYPVWPSSISWGRNYINLLATVYPKKYAHGFCFAVLCCGYTLTDFPISIRLTSLALWQSNDCPSASKATLMNIDKYFMWIHYERLHNHNKANRTKPCACFLWYTVRPLLKFCSRRSVRILVASSLSTSGLCLTLVKAILLPFFVL